MVTVTIMLASTSGWARAISFLDHANVIQQTANNSVFSVSPGNNHVGPTQEKVLSDKAVIRGEVCDGGHAVAMGLVFAVIIVPFVLYLILAGDSVSDMIITMIDIFISLFIAMLWFCAFSCILLASKSLSHMRYAEEVLAMFQALFMYAVVVGSAYGLKDTHNQLAIFCGCGAHYVAFAGIRATGEAQHEASQTLPAHHGPWMSLLIVIISFLLLLCASMLMRCLWKGKHLRQEFLDTVEDMELDIIGLVISFAITQTLQQIILGYYPSHLHFLQLDSAPNHGHQPKPTELQCLIVVVWSLVLTLGAAIVIPKLDDMADSEDSWIMKAARITKVILVMCIAWGYLLWGKWQFHEIFFAHDPMFAAMMFAVITTFSSLFCIVILSRFQSTRDRNVLESLRVSILGVSLVVAWSWEITFKTAVEIVAVRYQVGYGGFVPKIVMALVIPVFLLPFYIKHVKPRAQRIQEQDRTARRVSFEARHHHPTDSAIYCVSSQSQPNDDSNLLRRSASEPVLHYEPAQEISRDVSKCFTVR